MTTGLRTAVASAGKQDKRWFLPLIEVVDVLGISRSTIIRAYQAGEFPAIKLRGTYRVPKRFLDDLYGASMRGGVLVVEDYAKEWIARHGMPAEAVA